MTRNTAYVYPRRRRSSSWIAKRTPQIGRQNKMLRQDFLKEMIDNSYNLTDLREYAVPRGIVDGNERVPAHRK